MLTWQLAESAQGFGEKNSPDLRVLEWRFAKRYHDFFVVDPKTSDRGYVCVKISARLSQLVHVFSYTPEKKFNDKQKDVPRKPTVNAPWLKLDKLQYPACVLIFALFPVTLLFYLNAKHHEGVRDVTLCLFTGLIKCLAALNDGRRIVSGSKDQSLKIWDLISLQCCVTLKGHTDLIWRVAVASNDSFIVSASKDDMLKVSPFYNFLAIFPLSGFFFHLGIHFPEWCARIWSNTNFNLLEFWFPLISCTIDISMWCSHSTALLIYETKPEKLHWQNTIMKWKPVWNNSCRTFTITSETIGTLLVREFSGDFLLSRRKAGADVLVSATQQRCRWSITSWQWHRWLVLAWFTGLNQFSQNEWDFEQLTRSHVKVLNKFLFTFI